MNNKIIKNLWTAVLIITFLFPIYIMGQDNLDVFKKVSSNWKTDFSKHSVDFSKFMGGGPQRDGITAIDNPKFISIKEAKSWLGWEYTVVS